MLTISLCFADDATDQADIFKKVFRSNSLTCVHSASGEAVPVVLLLSPAVGKSDSIRTRLSAAIQSESVIYPVFLQKMTIPKWLQFLISSHQWLDTSEGNIEKAASRIARKLLLEADSVDSGQEDITSPGRFNTFRVHPITNFVGRSKELSDMDNSILHRTSAAPGVEHQSPQLTCIKGNAGIGKTSMIFTFLNNAEGLEETGWLSVSSEADDSYISYMLWARVVVELAGGETCLPELGDSLRRSLGKSFDNNLVEETTLLLPILATKNSTGSEDIKERHERVVIFIAELLRAAFTKGRSILFLDNLHWTDPGSLEMLGEILEKLEGTPLKVILSYRPERPNGISVEIPFPENVKEVEEILLEPLKQEESTELLNLLVDTENLDRGTFEEITTTSGGYPFHLELIARTMNTSRNSCDYSEKEFSDIRLLIQSNFKRLPEKRRSIAQVLSVLGGETSVELVLDTVCTKPALGKSVLLQNDDFIIRKQTAFTDTLAFRHDLLREAVYETMNPSVRNTYHFRAATLLEGKHLDDPRFSGMIATHWKKAGNYENSLKHALAYLSYVNQIYDSSAVLKWADKVELLVMKIGLCNENADNLAFALSSSEETLGRMGRIPLREKILNKLEDLATTYNLVDRLTSAYCSRGLIRKDQGKYDEAVKLVHKSADLAESYNNTYRAACSLGILGSIISDLHDRLDEAEKLYLKAMDMFESLDVPKETGKNCIHLGILYTDMGKNDKALEYCKRASSIFRSIDFHYGEAIVLTNIANVYINLGQGDKALTSMNRSAFLMKKAGDTHSLAIVTGNRANLFSSRGDLEIATEEYKKAIEMHISSDNSRSEKKTRCNLADCLRKRGLFDSALKELEKAEKLNEPSGDSYWKARIYEGRGRSLMEKGLLGPARNTLLASLEIIREIKYNPLEHRILNSLAIIAVLSEKYTVAEEYCSVIYLKAIEVKGNVTEVIEADIIMSEVMLAAKNTSKALKYGKHASTMAKQLDKPLLLAASIAAEGRVMYRTGNTVEGNRLMKNAASITDKHGYGNLFWFREMEQFR